MKATAAVVAALVLSSGCVMTRPTGRAVPYGGAPSYTPPPPYASVKLMLFGGMDHKIYLGCLNCSEFAADSIFNEWGSHGSSYSSESVHSSYGQFGSAYSNHSACSTYASDPPVIVDQAGKFYGRFSVNDFRWDSVCASIGRFKSDRVCAVVKKICDGN